MRRPSPSALLVIFAFFLTVASSTHAQDQLTRVEVGGQFDGIRLFNSQEHLVLKPGFGARLDINLTHRLALEATADFFPRQAAPIFGQGGQTFQFFAGIREKFVTSRHYSIYGVLRPGLTHETNNENAIVVTNEPTVILIDNRSGPLTHFTLDLGGGVEIYPTKRWILRAEADVSPYFIGNIPVVSATPQPPSGLVVLPSPGEIFGTWKFSLGASYRIGALREYPRTDNTVDQADPENHLGRLTVGAQASSLSLKTASFTDSATTEAGFGPFASYRIWRFVEADASMNFFPREAPTSGPSDGGRILQGLFGVRAGFRNKHVGVFAKARPGFQSYSKTLTSVTIPPDFSSVSLTFARATDFAIDLGGIVEIYPTKHFVIRLDAGDTSFYPGARNFISNGTSFASSAQPRQDTLQFGAGFGWRF